MYSGRSTWRRASKYPARIAHPGCAIRVGPWPAARSGATTAIRFWRSLAGLDGESTIVHEDRGSMLVVDREPIRWEGGSQRGLAWSERVEMFSGAGIGDWRDAACAGAACGLVVEGRRSYVHSIVAGVAPVYYMEHDGAVYFATTIDALALPVRAGSRSIGRRRPRSFRSPIHLGSERRSLRLGGCHGSRCCAFAGGKRTSMRGLAMAEVEPRLDVGAGAPTSSRPCARRSRACPLARSHARSAAASTPALPRTPGRNRRDDVSALTADPETGTDREIRIAARVAETVGVPHHAVQAIPPTLVRPRAAIAPCRLSVHSLALADA